VRIELASTPPQLQLTADPDRLRQVFWNLLTNAVKFTPSGGLVVVSEEVLGTELRITVRDTGEGIDPAFLPHVFERFSQANSTNVRVHGGLGIGLAIVRYIVELHGGTVAVDSPGKGRGATFTITLPLRVLPARAKKSKSVVKAVSTLKGLRLLVVDDEPDVRELLALVLQHEGAIVTTAASAQEALQALEANSPDILISDIAMPAENGYVLLERLRELERQQNKQPLPAIALTAFARDEDRKRALEAGFELHLSKPVSSEELISALMTVATNHLGKTG
jgi:CheY-like chemotaxis protein